MSPSPSKTVACSQPRRRWFQFSLRTLLIASAITAVWLAFWAVPAWRQHAAVEAIQQAGGSSHYESLGEPRDSSIPGWLRDLTGEEVRIVTIKDRDLTDSLSLKYISHLPNLETVSLSKCQFDAKDLAHLGASQSLQQLFLHDTATDDDALALVAELGELKMLGLARTAITDQGLIHICSLAKLDYLCLNGNDLSDRSVEHLSKMTNLRELELSGTRITPAALTKLRAALPHCEINGQRGDETSVDEPAP